MDLQPLFQKKIIAVEALSPDYEDHSSDVFLVRTDKEETVVRSSRSVGKSDGPFWGGCRMAFGIDPRNVHAQEFINRTLGALSLIRVPRILEKGFMDKEYILVEKLEGIMLESFIDQPHAMLRDFGENLARIHQSKMSYCGNPTGTFRISLDAFHGHMIRSMKQMLEHYYSNEPKIIETFPAICAILEGLRAPEFASYIMVDMDPTQFLTDGKTVTGLVDTEAYVVGPRELDFIALEYVMDRRAADSLIKGYEKITHLPDLNACRIPYRFFYRLIEIQGQEDIDSWLGAPVLF